MGDRPPALILLDYYRPGTTGYPLLDWLKQHPVYAQLPVVMMSAGATDQGVRVGYEASADAFGDRGLDFEKFRLTLTVICQPWLDRVSKC